MAPLLSIVIVSWNTQELLAACLHSVGRQREDLGPGQVETLVVDNASHDGSVERVEQNFGWVRLLRNSDNVGFATANNQAIAAARGQFVLLLNPDTEVRPGALAGLVRFMVEHPEAGAAGARLLNPDGTLQESCYPLPTLPREFWRLFHLDRIRPWAVYPMDRWCTVTPRPVDTVQGAALLVRREVLDQVGLLDDSYFIYSEEIDLCLRIQRAGWPIYWVPQAQVVHLGGQSTRQVAEEMFLHLYRSKLLYFRMNHGRMAAAGYKAILIAAAATRLVGSALLWFERGPQRQTYRALAANYRRLLLSLRSF